MRDTTAIKNVEDLLDFCADEPPGCTSIHLDQHCRFTCGTQATVLDSLEQWATDPSRISAAAAADRTTCGRRWVIFVRQDTPPTEADASHHLDIAAALRCEGVELIDVVIAWDDKHGSMRHLEHRTTDYDTTGWHDAA